MSDYYHSANELAGLPGLPGTGRGVQIWADREQIPYRKREKSGGGREYAESALPKAAQKALKQRRALAHVRQIEAQIDAARGSEQRIVASGQQESGQTKPASLATSHSPLPTWTEDDLKDWQRRVRDARHGICRQLQQKVSNGLSLEMAHASLLTQALEAGPDSLEYRMLRLAKDTRGRPSAALRARAGDPADPKADFPSLRTVQRWLPHFGGEGHLVALAPKARRTPFVMPPWGADFLACYQVPQKVSVQHAYDEYVRHQPPGAAVASIHQCRYLLSQLPAIVREKGRMGPRELKNIKPFVRRTFEHLWPNDVWSADGHTFDNLWVQHPLTGQPFRPEIVTLVDVGLRRVPGFSIGLAESALVVVDALRHGIMRHGVPAIFYVDNGPGFANQMLEDDAIGLAARVGFEVKHSLPYASQARGVIERIQRSVWVKLAKSLPGYMGADMDPEAKQRDHKLINSTEGNVTRLPLAWDLFYRCCEDAIAATNAQAHHGLPKTVDPLTGKRRHYTPDEWAAHRAEVCAAEGYAPTLIDPADTDSLFRPRVARTVLRAEIKFRDNVYFAPHLAEYHGEQVQIGFDIHDPDRIWVYDETGRYLGTANWHGNSKAYFPQPVIEQARDQRAAARVKRLDRKRNAIEAERTGRPALEAIPAAEIPGMRPFVGRSGLPFDSAQGATETAPIEAKPSRPKARSYEEPIHFPDPSDGRARYQLWRDLTARAAQGEDLPEPYRLFVQSFPNTRIYKIWDEHFNGPPLAAQASGH